MDDALTTVASGSIQVNIFAESTAPILPVKIICNASDHFRKQQMALGSILGTMLPLIKLV